MADVWTGGALGTITLDDVHLAIRDRLGLDGQQLTAFMADVWRQYLGSANTELIEYARGLRPRYRTGILSNSFVGAREREQAAYGFEDLVDGIVYSHEAGMAKPDPRIYALACDRLGARPGETVFLDDTEQCVAGARDVGIHAVHTGTTPRPSRRSRSCSPPGDRARPPCPGGGRDGAASWKGGACRSPRSETPCEAA